MKQNTDTTALIADTANRLRVVWLDATDEDAKTRSECLAEVIDEALASMPRADRPDFLERLGRRFPSWDNQVEVTVRPTEALPRSAADDEALKSWSFLLARLVDIAGTIGDAERKVIRDNLVAAGLVEAGGVRLQGDDVSAALCSLLGLPRDARIDAGRLLELLGLLAQCTEMADNLDVLFRSTWAQLPSKHRARPAAELKKNLARFISGDQRVGTNQVRQDIDRVRSDVAKLALAFVEAAGVFASQHWARFSPEAIGALVTGSYGRDAKCWKMYEELCSGHNAAKTEHDIKAAVANYWDQIREGTGT